MEQRLSLVTLGVRDVDASSRFYGRLGWRPSSASQAGITFFDAGGVVLALFGRGELAADAGASADGDGFRAVALAYNTRTREEVDQVLAAAVSAGGSLVKPASEASWGGYSGYFADPDGHFWEAAFNPGFPLDPSGRIDLLP